MFFKQFSVVVKQCGNGVLRKNIITYLPLHKWKVLCNVFLQNIKAQSYILTIKCLKNDIIHDSARYS